MTTQTSRSRTVRMDETHVEALADFMHAAWGAARDVQRIREARAASAAANPVAPGEVPPTYLFLLDDIIIGHVGTIPAPVSLAAEPLPAYWIKGLMVLPEHRSGPVGYLVLKQAVQELERSMTLVVDEPPRRLFRGLGYTHVGVLRNHLALLRPRRVFARIDPGKVGLSLPPRLIAAARFAQRVGVAGAAGVVAGAGLGVWRSLQPGERAETIDPMTAADRIDAVWNRVAPRFEASLRRDGAETARRFAHGPYTTLALGDRAVAAVRHPGASTDPRLSGVRVATLSELIFDPDDPAAGAAIVRAAIRTALEHDADALLASTTHAAQRAVLGRLAFTPIPGNLHFMVKEEEARLPTSSASWWLCRGDSSADDTF